MAEELSAAIRNLKALVLQHPNVLGAGLLLLSALWFLAEYLPSSNRSTTYSEEPSIVSPANESLSTDHSSQDLDRLLEDPALAKYGANGTDSALQLDLLNHLVVSPLTSPSSTEADPSVKLFDMTSAGEDRHQDDSAVTELEPTSTWSSLFPRSRLHSSSNSSPKSSSIASPSAIQSSESTLDRLSSPQPVNQYGLPPNATLNSPTESGDSSVTNLDGQSANPVPVTTPGQAASDASRSIDYLNGGSASSPAGTSSTIPPAFRTPSSSSDGSSSNSSFRTPHSSQIIQTVETQPSAGSVPPSHSVPNPSVQTQMNQPQSGQSGFSTP